MTAEALARIDAVLDDYRHDHPDGDGDCDGSCSAVLVAALREARAEIACMGAGRAHADPLVVREFLSGGLGYVIRRTSDGTYFWEWLEPGEPNDAAQSDYATELEAIAAAVLDWKTNGSGTTWEFVGALEAALHAAEAHRA